MLKNLAIKVKIALIVAVALIGLIAEIAISSYVESVTAHLAAMQIMVARIDKSILNLRKNEKDFLLRADIAFSESWQKEFIRVSELLSTLQVAGDSKGVQHRAAKLGTLLQMSLLGRFNFLAREAQWKSMGDGKPFA